MDSFERNNPPNNRNNNNSGKKGSGRKKTPKQKIENETNRHVTFYKRRSGLFKKSSELSTLCGADVSVIVFSPSNKSHSFGSPNVDAITRRFWHQTSLGITSPNQSPASQNNPITRQRNQDLTAMESHLEEKKKHNKELVKMKRGYQPNLEDFSIERLNEEMKFMLNFKDAYENGNGSSKGSSGLPTIDDQLWDYQSFQVQQPEYNMDEHFQTNGYMYNSGLDMYQFEMGSSSNANAVFPNPGQTLFIDPLDPTGNNFGYPYPNPNEASGSNPMLPYNYGFPTDDEDVPDDDVIGTGEVEEEEKEDGEEE